MSIEGPAPTSHNLPMLPPIIPFDATRILSDEEVVAAAAALRAVMARAGACGST